jgi:hypothetical protein
VFSVDTTAYNTIIKNVSVPQSEISLDSVSGGKTFYSGRAYYDIQTPGVPVPVHVYLEENPFGQYVIYTQKYFHGRGKFRKIDSLCTGDIGLVQSKQHCTVQWKYSTNNPANHCRIKIGLNNYLYAKTKDSLEGQTRWIYNYNNIGTIASTHIDNIGSGSTPSQTIVPKYSKGGQLMVDDTGKPFAVNGYDERERMTFTKEADQTGLIVHFLYGYVYDDKNRAIQKQQLQFGSTPQLPGTPFKADTFSYDSLDRLIHETGPHSYIFENTIFWPDTHTFNVLIKSDYSYSYNSDKWIISFDLYYDRDNAMKLLCSCTQYNYYNASGHLDSIHSIVKGLDAVGTIYGPRTYEEVRTVPFYDIWNYSYHSATWNKYYSPDSPYVNDNDNECFRREYDNAGNVLKQFDGCDSSEQLVWTKQYNKYNAPILQQVPDQINPGINYITRFYWELINLDTATEYYHE